MNEVELGVKVAGPARPHTVRYIDAPVRKIRGKIVRNPGYRGEPAGIYGWVWIPVRPTARKPGFHAALKESIARDGVRNPTVGYQTAAGLFVSFGQSRLRIARELELATIPMIVNDYTRQWSACPLVTPDNWTEFFTDVPEHVEFTPTGFEQHYALERSRRHSFDPAGLEWVKTLDSADWLLREFSWLKEET